MKTLASISNKRFVNKSMTRLFFSKENFSFSTKDNSDNKLKFNNVTDVKSFGRKFSDEELKKYLDPYGFLNTTKDKEIIAELSSKENEKFSASKENSGENMKHNEFVKKLEEVEKIEDPKMKADEKCKIMPEEYGFKYKGPEPTRYGDWEVKGKCVDF